MLILRTTLSNKIKLKHRTTNKNKGPLSQDHSSKQKSSKQWQGTQYQKCEKDSFSNCYTTPALFSWHVWYHGGFSKIAASQMTLQKLNSVAFENSQ